MSFTMVDVEIVAANRQLGARQSRGGDADSQEGEAKNTGHETTNSFEAVVYCNRSAWISLIITVPIKGNLNNIKQINNIYIYILYIFIYIKCESKKLCAVELCLGRGAAVHAGEAGHGSVCCYCGGGWRGWGTKPSARSAEPAGWCQDRQICNMHESCFGWLVGIALPIYSWQLFLVQSR